MPGVSLIWGQQESSFCALGEATISSEVIGNSNENLLCTSKKRSQQWIQLDSFMKIQVNLVQQVYLNT